MDPSKEERNVAKRQSSSDAQELDISLTPEKKARFDAEESKIITEISDLPDLELGTKLVELVNLKIWRNVLEDKKSLEAEILLQKQKIKELESKVNIRTFDSRKEIIAKINYYIYEQFSVSGCQIGKESN